MNVNFNFVDCPSLIAKCSLKSVSPTFYDKRDDFTFPLVNFPFISSNIPALPAYRVYISQITRYFWVCAQYSDFLDRTQTLTQKLLKQVAPRLKSPLQ